MIRSWTVSGGIVRPLLVLCLACSAQPETSPRDRDPSSGKGGATGTSQGGAPSTGNGGSFAQGGTTPGQGGAVTGTPQGGSGGNTTPAGNGGAGNTPGTATPMGGTGNASGGTTSTGMGGTIGAAGTTAMGGAVSSGTGGGSTAAGCDFKPTAEDTVVYSGGTPASSGTCRSAIDSPYQGFWYAYNDGTTGATHTPEKSASSAFPGEVGGTGGAMDCAFHTTGKGFAEWGAGVGIELNRSGGSLCPVDVSIFTGISVQLKGTTTGTHGAEYAEADDTIRVKVVTTSNSGGDDLGFWCTLTTAWSECKIPFAMLEQEGHGTAITFDPTKVTKIEFQAAKFGDATDPTTVSFDFWIDDIEFY